MAANPFGVPVVQILNSRRVTIANFTINPVNRPVAALTPNPSRLAAPMYRTVFGTLAADVLR